MLFLLLIKTIFSPRGKKPKLMILCSHDQSKHIPSLNGDSPGAPAAPRELEGIIARRCLLREGPFSISFLLFQQMECSCESWSWGSHVGSQGGSYIFIRWSNKTGAWFLNNQQSLLTLTELPIVTWLRNKHLPRSSHWFLEISVTHSYLSL